MYDVAEPKF